MTLTISNTRTDSIPVDFTGVTPAALAGMSLAEVQRLPVYYGNQLAALGELSRITGSPADSSWRLVGDFSAACALAAGMDVGEIVVEGSVGPRAGVGMRGGTLEVHGSAGNWLGAELRGGMIRIRGSAGDHVGAALPGSRRGMTGGTILIDGSVGEDAGARVRRGLLAVAGDAGDGLGHDMLAGTILVFGKCGDSPGTGMRRGTIAALTGERPELLPTFRAACRTQLVALRILESELQRRGFALGALDALTKPVEIFHGDLLELGRGEVLLPA